MFGKNCTLIICITLPKIRAMMEKFTGEGSGGEAQQSKDWHAQCRQEGNEQAVDKGASNAALMPSGCY